MLTNKFLDEFNRRLSHFIPRPLKPIQKEVEKNVHQLLNFVLNKLDVVTIEKFQTQEKVLKRTREKLDALEKKIEQLEKNKRKAA